MGYINDAINSGMPVIYIRKKLDKILPSSIFAHKNQGEPGFGSTLQVPPSISFLQHSRAARATCTRSRACRTTHSRKEVSVDWGFRKGGENEFIVEGVFLKISTLISSRKDVSID